MELFRAYEPQALIEKIAPVRLLMTIATKDEIAPADLAFDAYARAREPKELILLDCGHFDPYKGEHMAKNIEAQVTYLKKWFVK